MGKGTEITGGLLTLVGLVLFAVSFGTHYWYTFEKLYFTSTTSVGLFEECSGIIEVCSEFGWDSLQARIFFPRVLMTFAASSYGLGLLFHLISFCYQDGTKEGLIVTGSTFYFIGALFNLSAPAAMIGYIELENTISVARDEFVPVTIYVNFAYGYSFYLAWISAAVVFVASIVACCAGCVAKQTQQAVVTEQVIWTTGIPQTQIILLSQTGRPTTAAPIPHPMLQVPPDQSISQQVEYQW